MNLDAATGKLRWYYQVLPNDFDDHDIQDSPIAASINGAPVIVGGGKLGVRLRVERPYRQAGLEDPRGRARRP